MPLGLGDAEGWARVNERSRKSATLWTLTTTLFFCALLCAFFGIAGGVWWGASAALGQPKSALPSGSPGPPGTNAPSGAALEDLEQQDGDLEHAIQLMRKHGALAETLERARSYGAAARAALAPFRDCAEKRALDEVIDFCLERGF